MMIVGENVVRGTASISVFAAMIVVSAPCQASITISGGATQYMNCSGGVCSPTADKAVLNVADLEKLLASGATTVTTTGSGGVQAGDIFVSAALTWTSTNALTLNANRSLVIEKPVSVDGVAGLNLVFNTGGKGGPLEFRNQGSVTFSSLSSSLSINGMAYELVDSIKGLAAAIQGNPGGNYALAANYDASQDGTYSYNPISLTFQGIFEGLGNSISNFHMKGGLRTVGGLFYALEGGEIRDVGLVDVSVQSRNQAAGLLFYNSGTVIGCRVTGLIVTSGWHEGPGGLVALNYGTIDASYSSATVVGKGKAVIGGLVSVNGGTIASSFATGAVSQKNGPGGAQVGGLVGENISTITDSYATGTVMVGVGVKHAVAGGLTGVNEGNVSGDISDSYSIGAVQDRAQDDADTGGLIGVDRASKGSLSNNYWDTQTSGISNLSQGAGSPPNDPGITGLTTQQLQSGLPAGFDPRVWAKDSRINNGFPYLIVNPPPK